MPRVLRVWHAVRAVVLKAEVLIYFRFPVTPIWCYSTLTVL
jgi:hypothetical protein